MEARTRAGTPRTHGPLRARVHAYVGTRLCHTHICGFQFTHSKGRSYSRGEGEEGEKINK